MSNRYKTSVIDDVTAHQLDAALQERLLDLFESTMKTVACTLAHEASFDTSDYATAKACGCAGFILHLRRVLADSQLHRAAPSNAATSVWRCRDIWNSPTPSIGSPAIAEFGESAGTMGG